MFSDALLLLFEMADREDERFQAAAARWHARFVLGTSLAMIDLHYGHLASDGREHAVALLDALAREKLVDAGWTPPPAPASPHGDKPRATRRRTQTYRGGRSVDVTRTSRRRRPDERRR
jgi:hypothetical protein